jgi:hypothetical protein
MTYPRTTAPTFGTHIAFCCTALEAVHVLTLKHPLHLGRIRNSDQCDTICAHAHNDLDLVMQLRLELTLILSQLDLTFDLLLASRAFSLSNTS